MGLLRGYCSSSSAKALFCRSGLLLERHSAEAVFCRSGPLPKRSSAKAARPETRVLIDMKTHSTRTYTHTRTSATTRAIHAGTHNRRTRARCQQIRYVDKRARQRRSWLSLNPQAQPRTKLKYGFSLPSRSSSPRAERSGPNPPRASSCGHAAHEIPSKPGAHFDVTDDPVKGSIRGSNNRELMLCFQCSSRKSFSTNTPAPPPPSPPNFNVAGWWLTGRQNSTRLSR